MRAAFRMRVKGLRELSGECFIGREQRMIQVAFRSASRMGRQRNHGR